MTVTLRERGREHNELLAQIGVRLVDDLTNRPPQGGVSLSLEVDDAGTWRKTDIAPVVVSRGIYAWVNLERRRDPTGPSRSYRVRVEAKFYRAVYSTVDGEEFDVHPWNDTHPPAATETLKDIQLLPAANYGFPAHLPVIHGLVTNAGGSIADAMVTQSNKSRVLSDERGAFAIPLLRAVPGTAIAIDAATAAESGTINVTLPDDLGNNHLISIA